MTNIFVSYAREDKARVAQLVALIDSWSAEVWWDDRLVAGESFTEETERRLREADFVVVVWSPHSARSKWVLDEAAVGRDAEKLIPLSFDGQAPPLGFRHVHCTDFTDWNGEADARCAGSLKAALLRDTRQPTVSPHLPPAPQEGWRSLLRVLRSNSARVAALAVLAAALIGAVVLFANPGRPTPASIAKVTEQIIAGRGADDPSAALATKAVAEIGASARAADKAAFSSFAAGDQRPCAGHS